MKHLNAALIGLGAALAFNGAANTVAVAHDFKDLPGVHDNDMLKPGWNKRCGDQYCTPMIFGEKSTPPNAPTEAEIWLDNLQHKYLGNKRLSFHHKKLTLTIPF